MTARDSDFEPDEPDAPVPSGRRFIVTIGIDEYRSLPRLYNAVSDARGVQSLFVERLGFLAPLDPYLDERATKAALEELVIDSLPTLLQEEDSLVIFFAGHGASRTLKAPKETLVGYLAPVDAREGVWSDHVNMTSWLDAIDLLPARHVLLIIDACKSGMALKRSVIRYREPAHVEDRYRAEISRRVSRKAIVSALAEEKARDDGPYEGHSLFCGVMLQSLRTGSCDLDHDGLVTGHELGTFLHQRVGRYATSAQIPKIGVFGQDDDGELVIELSGEPSPRPVISSHSEQDEQRLKAHYVTGLKAKSEHRWSEAELAFFEVIKIDPEYLDARRYHQVSRQRAECERWYAGAVAAIDAKRWSDAHRELSRLRDEYGEHHDTAPLLKIVQRRLQLESMYTEAQMLFDEGCWDAVLSTFGQMDAIEAEASDPNDLRTQAEERLRAERLRPVIHARREQISRMIRERDYARAQAAIDEFRSEGEDPSTEREQVVGELREALGEALRRCLAFAQQMADQARWKESIDAYDRLLALGGEWADLQQRRDEVADRDLAEDLYGEAQRLSREEAWEAVLQIFEQMDEAGVRREDDDGLQERARAALAEISERELYDDAMRLYRGGSIGAALQIFETIVEQDPDFEDASTWLDRIRAEKATWLHEHYREVSEAMACADWSRVIDTLDAIISSGLTELTEFSEVRKLRAQAEGKREAEDAYRRAVTALREQRWWDALQDLEFVQARAPGYKETDFFINKARDELERPQPDPGQASAGRDESSEPPKEPRTDSRRAKVGAAARGEQSDPPSPKAAQEREAKGGQSFTNPASSLLRKGPSLPLGRWVSIGALAVMSMFIVVAVTGGGGADRESAPRSTRTQGTASTLSTLPSKSGRAISPASLVPASEAPMTASDCAERVFIKGGRYVIHGQSHTIPDLCIDRTEVTVGDYERCGEECEASSDPPAHPCEVQLQPQWPMVCVDQIHAQRYCEFAGGRLPSAIEWEWAARGGEIGRRFPWGSSPPSCEVAVLNDRGAGCRMGTTAPAYRSLDSQWPVERLRNDVRDLGGNVREWALDHQRQDSSGGVADYGIVKGAGFRTRVEVPPNESRFEVSYGDEQPRRARRPDLGFRCVSPPE